LSFCFSLFWGGFLALLCGFLPSLAGHFLEKMPSLNGAFLPGSSPVCPFSRPIK
jgi:hypothetical protein